MKNKKTKIEISVPKTLDIKEFKKSISFVSEEILGYSIEENKLIVECQYVYEKDIKLLTEKITKSMEKFISEADSKEVIFDSTIYNAECAGNNKTVYKKGKSRLEHRTWLSNGDIMNGKSIIKYDDGIIGFSGCAVRLFEYFDNVFRGFAEQFNAVQERYPVLLPLKTLNDTGYLNVSPQYQIFCKNMPEDIEKFKEFDKGRITTALSPSACFHVYERYRNTLLSKAKTVTLLQNVFRNEGRFNFEDFGRLKDYHVREIVFIGDEQYVLEGCQKLMEMTKAFIRRIGLSGRIESASDAFIIPQMQRYKLIQLKNRVKYEVRLEYMNMAQIEHMAVGSFNLHGRTFTYPFNIKVKQIEDKTVTGCVGFGIERWVLCFLSQFGEDENKWSKEVQKEIYG